MCSMFLKCCPAVKCYALDSKKTLNKTAVKFSNNSFKAFMHFKYHEQSQFCIYCFYYEIWVGKDRGIKTPIKFLTEFG